MNLLIRHAGGATNTSQRNESFCGQSSQSDLPSGNQTSCQNLQETHELHHPQGQSFPSTSDTLHNASVMVSSFIVYILNENVINYNSISSEI